MVHAYERIGDWQRARERAGRMLLALDFDGTLAPIVPVPDDAALLPAAHDAIGRLLQRPDTMVAVVSGRALADVRRRVDFAGVYYAGNHGLEIEGPDVHRLHAGADAAARLLADCATALRATFADEPDVLVEDKRLTLSVHYRLVDDPVRASGIRARVAACCGGRAGLTLTEGKKVVEVRPDVDWHKGRATTFLVDTLLGADAGAPVVYIGDDRTDEDAFRALHGRGEGVLVAARPDAASAASAWLRSPDEVATLLDRLGRTA